MDHADTALAHASAMRQFGHFAQSLGIELAKVCPSDLYRFVEMAHDTQWLPASAHVDVLQAAAIGSGRADLGVTFAMWCDLRGFGPVSQVWDHCQTLDEALRLTRRYMHLESAAVRSSMDIAGHEAAGRHVLMVPTRAGGSQFLEGMLTLQLRIARWILGEEWRPIRLELTHPAPDKQQMQKVVFGCPIEYEADRCALVFRKSDLHRPSLRGDPARARTVERELAEAGRRWPGDVVQQVRYFVASNLTERCAKLPHVAALAGLSTQSLQRRLTERGTSFATVLEETRRQTADEYFRTARRPNLTELSRLLGYTDASAASRFLRQHMATGARAMARSAHASASRQPEGGRYVL